MYEGPPVIITHDAGTKFASVDFRSVARILRINLKYELSEAHKLKEKVERYFVPLRRAFWILHAEMSNDVSPEEIFQISIITVNNTTRTNSLVHTILVYGVCPQLTLYSPPSSSTMKQAEAIPKVIKVLCNDNGKRQVHKALNIRSGFLNS